MTVPEDAATTEAPEQGGETPAEPTTPAEESTPSEPEKPQTARSVMEEAVEQAREQFAGDEGADESVEESSEGETGEVEEVDAGTTESEQKKPREPKTDFTIIRDGEEVELDPERLESEKIRYKANGREVEKSLDELVRNAQKGHGSEEKVETLREQRNELNRELQQTQRQQEALQADRDLFLEALRDESGETFQQVQEQFLKGTQGGEQQQGSRQEGRQEAPPEQGSQEAPDLPPGVTEDDVRRGAQVAQDHLMPHAEALAEAYPGSDAGEILQATLLELQEEPPQFVTPETVAEIVNERVPRLLEEAGYERAGDVPGFDASSLGAQQQTRAQSRGITPREAREQASSSDPEAEKLRKENEQLREKLEAQQAQRQKEVVDGSPPGAPEGGGGSGTGRGSDELIDTSEVKSAADYKKKLQELRRNGGRR